MCCDICFFSKQKTTYDMRISYWSSDVCSSDLIERHRSETVRGQPHRGPVGTDGRHDRHPRRETTQRIAKGARVRSGAIFGHGARRTAFEEIDQIGAERVVAVVSHDRSEEHTSELQSLMRISYAVFCLKKKN